MLWLLPMPLQETKEDKQKMENIRCNSPVLNSSYNTEGGSLLSKNIDPAINVALYR